MTTNEDLKEKIFQMAIEHCKTPEVGLLGISAAGKLGIKEELFWRLAHELKNEGRILITNYPSISPG